MILFYEIKNTDLRNLTDFWDFFLIEKMKNAFREGENKKDF